MTRRAFFMAGSSRLSLERGTRNTAAVVNPQSASAISLWCILRCEERIGQGLVGAVPRLAHGRLGHDASPASAGTLAGLLLGVGGAEGGAATGNSGQTDLPRSSLLIKSLPSASVLTGQSNPCPTT